MRQWKYFRVVSTCLLAASRMYSSFSWIVHEQLHHDGFMFECLHATARCTRIIRASYSSLFFHLERLCLVQTPRLVHRLVLFLFAHMTEMLRRRTCAHRTHACARCGSLLNKSGYGIDTACLPCPDAVVTINLLVIATTVIGSVSMAACLCVVVAIIAHGRDLVSMRDRIIIGLMAANAVCT